MHGQTGEQPMNPKGDDSLESGTHEVPHQDQAVPHQRKSPQPVPHHQSAPFPRSTITGDLLKPLAEKVMATPTGRTATAVLPDVPWVEIMGLHMLYVAVMKLDRSIEEVAAAEIPNLVEQADAHPLHAAASTGRIDSSRCLALVSKKKSTSSGNRLKEASGDVEMDVRGFECDELDGYGKSALHWASAAGREDWVVALLRAGANPNIADQRGMTALHEAVVGKHISVVRVLVETGADVRYQERMRGRSALHFAAMFGNAKLVKILCENGAKHELRDRWDGFTPLMSAVAKGQLETTETLLDCGADPEAEVRWFPMWAYFCFYFFLASARRCTGRNIWNASPSPNSNRATTALALAYMDLHVRDRDQLKMIRYVMFSVATHATSIVHKNRQNPPVAKLTTFTLLRSAEHHDPHALDGGVDHGLR